MSAVTVTKPIVAFLFSLMLGNGGNGKAGTAEVKFIPVSETQGVFNVNYDNATGSRFSLQIQDEDGNQLYQHVYSDKKFNKNFQLADPENYHKLIFVIRNLEDNSSQRFEVEATTHLIEDVDVRELK
jgi:hypothetical protein